MTIKPMQPTRAEDLPVWINDKHVRATHRVKGHLAHVVVDSARRHAIPITAYEAQLIADDVAPVILRLPYTRRAENVPADKTEVVLTVREHQVLIGLALGLTSAQIGVRLGLDHQTIRTRRAVIYQKLGAVSAAHAVALALKYGQLTLADITDV